MRQIDPLSNPPDDSVAPDAHASQYLSRDALLTPRWSDRAAQATAAAAIAALILALWLRWPLTLIQIDAIVLRNILPAGMAIVLSFAPAPKTEASRVAKRWTCWALILAILAGDHALALLACYPLLLAAAVARTAWAASRRAPA